MLYTMLTRGRVENHAHIVLSDEPTHALPSPTVERAMTATEVLEGILARDGAAVSATSTQARATSPAAQLQDAVTRYADAVALATSQMRANPDLAEPGPLPWLAGIPSEVVSHSAWGPYLAARSRRVSSLAAEVAADPVLPEWTAKYDDVLTPDLRRELAVWRAATGVPADERTLAGPVPHDDREAAYHRNLTGRINARYGEAVKTWADRIVEYVGRRDEQTGELAKYLDRLARKGIDAERILDLAAARKPLPSTTRPPRWPIGSRTSSHRGSRVGRVRRSTRSPGRPSATVVPRLGCNREIRRSSPITFPRDRSGDVDRHRLQCAGRRDLRRHPAVLADPHPDPPAAPHPDHAAARTWSRNAQARPVARVQVRGTARRAIDGRRPMRSADPAGMGPLPPARRGGRPHLPLVEGGRDRCQQRSGALQGSQSIEIEPHTTVVVRPVARTPTPEVLPRRRDRASLCGDDAVRQDCTR